MLALSHDDGDFAEAAVHLDAAVGGMLKAGRQEHLAKSFLTRAEYFRVTGDFSLCQRDLEEASGIGSDTGEARIGSGYSQI